ncbi:sigma-70 family RNA polymerase sigma factor [Pseudonocardia sp. CA-107938]|uniref:sigma-70 family RNA polymerase sigma factor n=1 Tax=Pseudonocardia sp. CA-107938 TaxID=3240021 RepID=UPI003D8BB8B4
MDETAWLAERFERERPRLRAVAHRMLGSETAADDAVQDAWLRLSSAEAERIDNLGGWLTTVVARECLHQLRSRRRRREEPADPAVPAAALDPEQEALLADSVGLALLVVLDRLTPGERLAFVLHDLFDVPFADIAAVVGRSPAAARQLASRARRRVRGGAVDAPDLARQRQVVDAFYAAARAADFDALVRVLDPEVELRTDFGSARPPLVVRGAAAVATGARVPRGARLHPVLLEGMVGAVVTRDGHPTAVMTFAVVDDRIVRIDVLRAAR